MDYLTVEALAFYPVKSARGLPLSRARIDERGIVLDRHWMVVSEARGRFLTQRGKPQLALIETEIGPGGELTLRARGRDPITIDPCEHRDRRRADIWNDLGLAVIDQGDEAAEWVSDHLSKASRLVRIADDTVRPVDREYTKTAQVGLADGFPLLVTATASLEDLNDRLVEGGDERVPMDRFRPNIVVAGGDPYADDTWQTIRIGDVVVDLPKPCARCEIANTDQATADRSPAVLAAIGKYREPPGAEGPLFGWNGIHRAPGTIETGMPVEVLTYRTAAATR